MVYLVATGASKSAEIELSVQKNGNSPIVGSSRRHWVCQPESHPEIVEIVEIVMAPQIERGVPLFI